MGKVIRTYEVEDVTKGVYFCPVCHVQIFFPFKGKIKVSGGINLGCGRCKRGVVRIKTKQPEIPQVETPKVEEKTNGLRRFVEALNPLKKRQNVVAVQR